MKEVDPEYLAHYALAALGTISPVPHQEDIGIDIYCTLLEHEGRVGYPSDYYCVQVKSDTDRWVLDNPKSIEWLVRNPSPLFLCVVIKAEARVLVYPTLPRFDVWRQGPLPSSLTFILHRKSQGTVGQYNKERNEVHVYAPALNFTATEMSQPHWRTNAYNVLRSWIFLEKMNLFSVLTGVRTYSIPGLAHKENVPLPKGSMGTFSRTKDERLHVEAMAGMLFPQLQWLAVQQIENDQLVDGLLLIALLRQLKADDVKLLSPYWHLCQKISPPTNLEGFLSKGIDFVHNIVLRHMANALTEIRSESSKDQENVAQNGS